MSTPNSDALLEADMEVPGLTTVPDDDPLAPLRPTRSANDGGSCAPEFLTEFVEEDTGYSSRMARRFTAMMRKSSRMVAVFALAVARKNRPAQTSTEIMWIYRPFPEFNLSDPWDRAAKRGGRWIGIGLAKSTHWVGRALDFMARQTAKVLDGMKSAPSEDPENINDTETMDIPISAADDTAFNFASTSPPGIPGNHRVTEEPPFAVPRTEQEGRKLHDLS